MSGCRDSRMLEAMGSLSSRFILFLAASLLLLADTATAQQSSGPIRLMPPTSGSGEQPNSNQMPSIQGNDGQVDGQSSGQSDGFTGTLAPSSGFAPLVPSQTVSPSMPRRGIQIESLARPSLETIGPLEPQDGGFGYDLWEGSHRGIVLGLMRQLPGDLRSYWGEGMARRLLLTNAEGPEAGPEATDLALLRARIQRLIALGHIADAATLIDLVAGPLQETVIAREKAEVYLYLGQYDEACNTARGRVERSMAAASAEASAIAESDPDFWQKTLIFCNIRAGEIASAQLGLRLMQELGGDAEGAFLALGQRMLDGAGHFPEKLPSRAPELAMADQLGEALPEGMLALGDPKIAVAALRLKGLLSNERVTAAETAAASAALDGDGLRDAYRSVPFSQQQITTALSLAGSQPGGLDRALLLQAAEAESPPSLRAELVLTALEEGRADGLYYVTALAFAPSILSLEPEPDLLWFAGSAGRALYALGKYEGANAWFDLARRESMVSPQAQASLTTLWPYARLAGFSASDWDGSLAAWGLARNESREQIADLQTLLASAFEALGQAEMSDLSRQLANYPTGTWPEPNNNTLLALRDAADGNRRGEAILLSLVALAPEGTLSLHPRKLEAICSALIRLGYPEEARRLAIEAAVRAGI